MQENLQKFHKEAVGFIGHDASPRDLASDEYGCAESVNEIYKRAFGEYISPENILSTRQMYFALLNSVKFSRTMSPEEGTIIISPTGYSTRGFPTGHCGIVGKNGIVMSNDSLSGMWLENYTIPSWILKYEKKMGFPVLYFNKN